MTLTGFSDEAAPDLATQIKVTQELGWQHISARGIDGKNIHDLTDKEFDTAYGQLQDAGIHIAEFGSLIGSWSKSIHSDFAITLTEVERCIPRMQQLGTEIVRIMSYAQEPWGDDQHEQERFRRLREITTRFTDAGLTAAHENCMNYGGLSSTHTLRLIEEVPDLKLIFDTGNPIFQRDRSIANSTVDDGAERSDGRSASSTPPWQDAWMFYQEVIDHTIHIHIKDCRNPKTDGEEPEYTFPGEGQAYIPAIIDDLKKRNYNGFIAIEPHVATVFHAKSDDVDWNQCYQSYLDYGKAIEKIISATS